MLAAAALLPALAATSPARACSQVLKSPTSAGRQNQRVIDLFEAWWLRDKNEFEDVLNRRLMDDGSPMDSQLARELYASAPIEPETVALFDRFFTDQGKGQQIVLMANADAGIVVICSEADRELAIQPDCTGTPRQHIFLVDMEGLNFLSVTHISSRETARPDSVAIWADGRI
jgi:hypothetical protein